MKALIQTGSSLSACGHAQAGGRVSVPLKSDFLSIVIKEQIGVAELGLRVVGLFQLRKTAAALDAEYVVKCLRHSPLW